MMNILTRTYPTIPLLAHSNVKSVSLNAFTVKSDI
jgi:hypothetical protein